MIVNIDKFIDCVEFIEEIKAANVDDILIELNGCELKPSQVAIDNFKLTGMDNLEFVKMALYIEEKED